MAVIEGQRLSVAGVGRIHRQPGKSKASMGEGTVTQILKEHYSGVNLEPWVSCDGGTFVEKLNINNTANIMRRMRYLWSLLFFLSSIGSAQEVTLKAYLDEVREANPTIRSSQLRAQALEHRIEPAGTLDDPFFAAGVDQVPFDGSAGSVRRYQLSQSIPFPGKLGAKSDIAENKARSAHSDSETVDREITVLATQFFYQAFFNQKALELNEKLRNLVEGAVESTKARYKTGDSSHHDWLLAKIELNVFNVERLKLIREQKTIAAILNELRDQPTQTPIGPFAVVFINDDLPEEALPFKNQPELKSLDALLTQAESEQKLAKLAYFPDFVIQGMVMQPGSDMIDEKSNWGVMVGVTLPIFFWRKQSELVNAASIDREAVFLEKKNLENRLNTEVVDSKQQLKTARDVVELYQSAVIPTTNLAVQNARSGYAAMRLPLGQFIETLKVQRTQELEFIAAQIDVALARTRLEKLLSAPPLLRLAPAKPSLFGGGRMGSGATGSDTVNMGRGMSGPARKSKGTSGPGDGTGSGMGGM